MQTILIIDDDRDICLLLKRFLTRHNYDVIEAYSGKKALELLEETEPALVMCDFRLEDMEGNTLLGKIKEKYLHLLFSQFFLYDHTYTIKKEDAQ